MLDLKFTEARKRQRRKKFRRGGKKKDVPLQDLAKVMRDLAKVVTQVNVFPAEFPAVKDIMHMQRDKVGRK